MTYNDIDSVKKIFEENPKEIACVIMMPFELEKPKSKFLKQVKEIAHKHGALFILDEMRTGFRMSLGGVQEYFNLQADLATYSKAIANGYPISAIVGKRKILARLKDTQMAATFFSNSPEIAAAKETISILKTTDSLKLIWELGLFLKAESEKLIQKLNMPAEFLGYPPFPFIRFTITDKELCEKVKLAFFSETTKLGVFLHPNHHWYISAAHTKRDINKTIEVLEKAFRKVKKLL